MESFYHSLKGELIQDTVFNCVNQLRKALRVYINKFYNTVRLHSGINYLSPIEYEQSSLFATLGSIYLQKRYANDYSHHGVRDASTFNT